MIYNLIAHICVKVTYKITFTELEILIRSRKKLARGFGRAPLEALP